MTKRENYDPDQPVCQNQDDFNKALREAIKYNFEQNNKLTVNTTIFLMIYLVFFVWAIMLALCVQKGPYRTMHLAIAMVFSPFYVVAHYLGKHGGSDTE